MNIKHHLLRIDARLDDLTTAVTDLKSNYRVMSNRQWTLAIAWVTIVSTLALAAIFT